MIADVVESQSGRRAARSLFTRPARHVTLASDDQGTPTGAIVRVDEASGVVVELLAAPDTARAALWHVVARFGLVPDYPPEVLRAADALVAAPGLDDPTLVDLTDRAFVTIDNADSRDLDQAMHIEARDDGGFDVLYALADASYYVRPGTPLFDDAVARGASFYLPGLTVPMLPRPLSEGIVSLNEGVLRRALVVETRVADDGHAVATRIYRARIRSRRKLTYDGVQAYYDDPAASPLAGQAFTATLEHLRAVGRRRMALADAEDVVRYNRVSLSVGVAGPDGRRFTAVGDARNDCERYNEQISLLCNIEGARFLVAAAGGEVPSQPIFRVHPAPEPPRFEELVAVIDGVVAAHGLDPAVWRWRRRDAAGGEGESLAAYLERLPREGAAWPLFLAVQRQALVINQRSSFQAEPGMHYGVGAPYYSRFSSPMREVVGIFTHKEALEALAGEAGGDDDEALRERVIEAANRSKEVQRQLTKEANLLVIDALLGEDLARPEGERPWRAGFVLGMKFDRLYVQLDAPPIEVKLYLKDIAAAVGGSAAPDGDVVATVTRGDAEVALRVGDAVRVRVAGYDEARRRWLLVPEAAAALVG
ncbi:MAG: RNB domain-containing ribonuclease [Deltaproteobacteria bacterium]|nr:MAG: RNB domain-containing ribonuclease [Deltaproteobacteria bacterium]